jgi:hypothetical protein
MGASENLSLRTQWANYSGLLAAKNHDYWHKHQKQTKQTEHVDHA